MRDGLEVIPSVRSGSPATEILLAAEEYQADFVVVGSEGRSGVAGLFLGSVARNVAKHARHPVLVGRAPRNELKQIILAVDESEHANQACQFLKQFPLPIRSEILVAHITRPYHFYAPYDLGAVEALVNIAEDVRRERKAVGEQLVERIASSLRTDSRQVSTLVREGDPASEILELVSGRAADLLVMGARGVSPIQGLLVGSVADRLLGKAHSSVLIVH